MPGQLHLFRGKRQRGRALPAPKEARWKRDGTLPRLFEVGRFAQARMEREYDAYIHKLTLDRVRVTGLATETLPRWTHVRQR